MLDNMIIILHYYQVYLYSMKQMLLLTSNFKIERYTMLKFVKNMTTLKYLEMVKMLNFFNRTKLTNDQIIKKTEKFKLLLYSNLF